MKKVILGLVAGALMLAGGAAMAGDSVSFDYASKQKSGVTEQHDVIGVNAGTTVGKFGLEGRMEDEIVHDPSKHEGLAQVKGSYPIGTWYKVTPYVAAGVGYKSKATSNFSYYLAEGGVKYPLLPTVDLKAAVRIRSPFNEGTMGSGNKYRTVEESLGASWKFYGKNALTAKYAYEHGDSKYHTWGVGVAHSF